VHSLMLSLMPAEMPSQMPLSIPRECQSVIPGEVRVGNRSRILTEILTGMRVEIPTLDWDRIPGEMLSQMAAEMPSQMPGPMFGDRHPEVQGETRGWSTPLRPLDVKCVTYAISC
jgi:hypothetical protein